MGHIWIAPSPINVSPVGTHCTSHSHEIIKLQSRDLKLSIVFPTLNWAHAKSQPWDCATLDTFYEWLKSGILAVTTGLITVEVPKPKSDLFYLPVNTADTYIKRNVIYIY